MPFLTGPRREAYFLFFFFNDTATTEIYTLSLHDALPIFARCSPVPLQRLRRSPTLGIGGRNGTCHPSCDPQSAPTSRSPSRGTPKFSGNTSSEPLLPSCPDQEGRLPCFVWKGFPTFRSHLRMRPVSRRHSRRGLVGASTFRRTPISQSPLDKNPMPGHLPELHPVNEVHTKGQFFRASFGKNPRFQIQLDKRPLPLGPSREASGVPCLHPRRGLTLRSPVCRDPAIGVCNQRYPAVPASTGDEALFQCTKPSGVPRGPSHLQFPWLLRATMRSPLRSPAQVEGTQGFLPQPGKALERPSSTRLEARFPYHGSGAMTRSPSPLAWRPDFPGAPREDH